MLFSSVIDEYLPEPAGSLLKGMSFGVPIRSSLNLYNQMKRVGTSHIAVFSGANISIALGAVSFIRGYIGIRYYCMLAILTIFFLASIVGMKAPVARASLFSLCTYVAILLGRKISPLYTILFSFLVLLCLKPYWIQSVSFQLSYTATIALVLAGKARHENSDNYLISYIKEEMRISTAAMIGTAPIIFFNFRQVSLIAPLANVLISFAVGPVLILGLMAGFLGTIDPVFGYIPAQLAYPFLSYIIAVSEFLSSLSFASVYF